jgi:hypothetical protein
MIHRASAAPLPPVELDAHAHDSDSSQGVATDYAYRLEG